MSEEERDWLPPLLLMEEFGGNWDQYLAEVYRIFRGDFIASTPRFRGQRVSCRKIPVSKEKEAGFWHAISEGEDEEARIPDFRRCERIAWIRLLIEREGHPEVHCWESSRPGERRVILTTGDFSFVVVLALRKDYVLFITAYHVEKEHRREKLRKEFERCKKP